MRVIDLVPSETALLSPQELCRKLVRLCQNGPLVQGLIAATGLGVRHIYGRDVRRYL